MKTYVCTFDFAPDYPVEVRRTSAAEAVIEAYRGFKDPSGPLLPATVAQVQCTGLPTEFYQIPAQEHMDRDLAARAAREAVYDQASGLLGAADTQRHAVGLACSAARLSRFDAAHPALLAARSELEALPPAELQGSLAGALGQVLVRWEDEDRLAEGDRSLWDLYEIAEAIRWLGLAAPREIQVATGAASPQDWAQLAASAALDLALCPPPQGTEGHAILTEAVRHAHVMVWRSDD